MNVDDTEKEDDWGWFIPLELDVTTTNKNGNYFCKTLLSSLQPINENQEYYTTIYTTKKHNYTIKNIMFYSVFYNCINYIYKYINPFLCYKQK